MADDDEGMAGGGDKERLVMMREWLVTKTEWLVMMTEWLVAVTRNGW